MNLTEKVQTKNESKLYYVGLGILMGIGVFFAVRGHPYGNNGVIIQPPKIEAR